MVYVEMLIVFMFILAGIIMMQERVSNGPRIMISVLLFVFVGFKMATAATYTVGNTTTTQIQQVDNSVSQYQDNSVSQYQDNSINSWSNQQSYANTTNHVTNHNRVKHGGSTTGHVSINKDQHTYYNQQCVQNCVVYMIETPKIQYIRK